MSTIALTRGRRPEWVVPALLILLAAVPAVAGTTRVIGLARGGPVTAANVRFFDAPIPVVVHVLTALPFAILGALQFSPASRRGRYAWHRLAGRWLLASGLVTALTGLWMAHFYPWPEGDGALLYVFRLVFGTLMLASLLLAVNAVRRRDFVAHAAWMTRGYAIGMGAGTQVLTHLPWFIFVGTPVGLARALMMGAGWMINLIVAEMVIRRRGSHLEARPALGGLAAR